MATATAMMETTLDTESAKVLATTGSMPLTSWDNRDCISPVRVRARKFSDIPSRWSYTASCRSPVTSCATLLVSQVWTMDSAAPATTTAAITPASTHSSVRLREPPAGNSAESKTSFTRTGVEHPQPGVDHDEQTDDGHGQLVWPEQPEDPAHQALVFGVFQLPVQVGWSRVCHRQSSQLGESGR